MSDDLPSNPLERASIPHFLLGRAGAAFSALLGSAVDIPKAGLERLSQGIRDGTHARTTVTNAVANAVAQKAAADPQIVERAMEAWVRREHRRQSNTEAVVEKTIELLEPSKPDEVSGTEKIDPDWLNLFQDYVGNASTERLRDVWARVLAGEIRKPSSFTPKTLRFVAELDQEVAATFEKYAGQIVDGAFIPKNGSMAGRELYDFMLMEDFGLIGGAMGHVTRKLKLHADAGRLLLRYPTHGIGLIGHGGLTISYPVVLVTRVGREIASILNAPESVEGARRFAEFCPKDGLETIMYGRIQPRSRDSVDLIDEQVVWAKDTKPDSAEPA